MKQAVATNFSGLCEICIVLDENFKHEDVNEYVIYPNVKRLHLVLSRYGAEFYRLTPKMFPSVTHLSLNHFIFSTKHYYSIYETILEFKHLSSESRGRLTSDLFISRYHHND